MSDKPETAPHREAPPQGAPPEPAPASPAARRIPMAIAAGVVAVVILGGLLLMRAESRTNKVALGDSAKRATVVAAVSAEWQPTRRYVGTIEPWVEARIGPQFSSAYVQTVLVRPGALVKQGQVLATLDCRNASAESQAVAMQAKALEARQEALAHEATRIGGLLSGGFASPNEVEQKTAESASKEAELLASRAKLARASLEVNDCILRAPFDGEISTRSMDPGAFARPGFPVVSMVDRRTVRVTADVPEIDFGIVAPGTPVTVRSMALGSTLQGAISRRAPAADASTRTVHFEVDLADATRSMPVGTTAEVEIDVGAPQPATRIPLTAATVRGSTASVFVVEAGIAHQTKVAIQGERGGALYLDPALKPGTLLVTEGRALLKDKDPVQTKVRELAFDEPNAPKAPAASKPAVIAPARREARDP